jgi:four helix bundle protein
MSTTKNIEETLLWKKANELAQKIQEFRKSLPKTDMDIYALDNKLKESVSEISQYIEESYRSSSKLAKNKNSFLAELALLECIDNLKKANRMKLGQANEIIEDAEHFRRLLNGQQLFIL